MAAVLSRAVVTTVNFGEVFYKLHQRAGMLPALVEAVFAGLGVCVEPLRIDHLWHFPGLVVECSTDGGRTWAMAGRSRSAP
jgi:hypothetical protein